LTSDFYELTLDIYGVEIGPRTAKPSNESFVFVAGGWFRKLVKENHKEYAAKNARPGQNAPKRILEKFCVVRELRDQEE
jgi:hypothetical protein